MYRCIGGFYLFHNLQNTYALTIKPITASDAAINV